MAWLAAALGGGGAAAGAGAAGGAAAGAAGTAGAATATGATGAAATGATQAGAASLGSQLMGAAASKAPAMLGPSGGAGGALNLAGAAAQPSTGQLLGNSLMNYASNRLTGGSVTMGEGGKLQVDPNKLASFLKQRATSSRRRVQQQQPRVF